jgi:hypothetical protein
MTTRNERETQHERERVSEYVAIVSTGARAPFRLTEKERALLLRLVRNMTLEQLQKIVNA